MTEELKGRLEKWKDIIDLLIYYLFIVLLVGILPTLALFAGGAGEIRDNFLKVAFYFGFLLFGLLLITSGKIAEFIVKVSKSEKVKNNIGWLASRINDWEHGFLSEIRGFGWLKSFWNQVTLGLILFTFMGLISIVVNYPFVALPPEQQVTKTADTILGIEPAVGSETSFFGGIFGFIMGLFLFFKIKYKWHSSLYWTLLILILIFVGAVGGVAFHLLVYRGSDVALLAVAIFWSLGALSMSATGSITLFYIMHFMNNLFNKMAVNFSNDATIAFVLIFLSLYLILFFTIKFRRRLRMRARQLT